MAASQNDSMLDAALAWVADNGGRLDICAGEPTTYTEATDTNSLGSTSLTTGTAGSDYAIGDGDTEGRKLTVSAQSGISIDADGTADHVALTDGTDTLVYVTTLSSSQSVTTGNTADIGAWDITVDDASTA